MTYAKIARPLYAALTRSFILSLLVSVGCMPAGPDTIAQRPIVPAAKGKPTMIEFIKTFCPACVLMEPVIATLQRDYGHALTIKPLNIAYESRLARQYQIAFLPTQIYLDAQGRELYRHIGMARADEIIANWRQLGYKMDPAPSTGQAQAAQASGKADIAEVAPPCPIDGPGGGSREGALPAASEAGF